MPYFRIQTKLFEVDGRIFELRWIWGFFSGNPKSIVIVYKGRTLARYGSDQAAQIELEESE